MSQDASVDDCLILQDFEEKLNSRQSEMLFPVNVGASRHGVNKVASPIAATVEVKSIALNQFFADVPVQKCKI